MARTCAESIKRQGALGARKNKRQGGRSASPVAGSRSLITLDFRLNPDSALASVPEADKCLAGQAVVFSQECTAVKRWPNCFLALAVAVTVAAVFAPYSSEPVHPDNASAIETVTGPIPETMALRGWAKLQIAREVSAGRRTLLDAAALYGELNQLPPVVNLSLHDGDNATLRGPVRTNEEMLCRQVMTWVEQLLIREAPDRVGRVVDRLEAEFRAALREQGAIRLPGRPSTSAVREVLEQARARMTGAHRQIPFRPGRGR